MDHLFSDLWLTIKGRVSHRPPLFRSMAYNRRKGKPWTAYSSMHGLQSRER